MIGYYAHSQGSGHCNYANLFSKIFGKSLTVFTDRNHAFDRGTDVVMLENEDPDGNEYQRSCFPEPRALHYAPVNIGKITRRNKTILDNVLKRNISLLIIDVSVEMAMLARVSSIPYAYVRLQGDRNDIPHLNAFEGASFLLAYFPKEMESVDTPSWITNKTVYFGFLSKFMFDKGVNKRPVEFRIGLKPILLHLNGFGGTRAFDFGNLPKRYDIYVIGPGRGGSDRRSGIEYIGVVDDTRAFINHADLIIAACGLNTTSELLSLGKRFVASPEKRHFEEQEYIARNLDRLGWAIDFSKYGCLNTAVRALSNIQQKDLPRISLHELEAFKAKLEFFGYRADKLAYEHSRNLAHQALGNSYKNKNTKIELSAI
ncbi:hypothetical protein SAMN05421636_11131 [Pricia antarctica]|uniref:Glycosyl transferase family 28 C-terminal domain-containing protein n=1 Tax=Pricia antarctica TaxID=641691 RepID=A0A1G7I6C8_9FLAO|nr:hypothetical protein [Pricia antarctica]SDF08222.1 hypothetical protein SAMN05421636_11131 [Pricia antarctica]